jgi:hypothetical protein
LSAATDESSKFHVFFTDGVLVDLIHARTLARELEPGDIVYSFQESDSDDGIFKAGYYFTRLVGYFAPPSKMHLLVGVKVDKTGLRRPWVGKSASSSGKSASSSAGKSVATAGKSASNGKVLKKQKTGHSSKRKFVLLSSSSSSFSSSSSSEEEQEVQEQPDGGDDRMEKMGSDEEMGSEKEEQAEFKKVHEMVMAVEQKVQSENNLGDLSFLDNKEVMEEVYKSLVSESGGQQ